MELDASPASRFDGRALAQLRALSCARGVLARADGSARWAQGGTSVLAAVYGPVEAAPGKQDAERAVVEVIFRPRAGVAGPKEREFEATLRRAIQGVVLAALHPRTIVQINLQVESEDGGVLAAAFNAAGAALVDAGVPMSSQLAAVAIACDTEGRLAMDPTAEEEEAAAAVGSFGYDTGSLAGAAAEGQGASAVPVLAMHVRGSAHVDAVHDMLDAAAVAAERIAAFLRLSTERDFEVLAPAQ